MRVNPYIFYQSLVFCKKQSMVFLPSNFPELTKIVSYDMRAIDTNNRIITDFGIYCSFSLDNKLDWGYEI